MMQLPNLGCFLTPVVQTPSSFLPRNGVGRPGLQSTTMSAPHGVVLNFDPRLLSQSFPSTQ